MKKYTFLYQMVVVLFTACSLVSCRYLDDAVTTPITSNCDKNAILDPTQFTNVTTTNYSITNVVLNGDCLEVTVSSSGCNPDNWQMDLIGAASLTNIYPPMFHAKVKLINNEACQAVFQKTHSFDLTPFQMNNQNTIQINIEGWNGNVVYQY